MGVARPPENYLVLFYRFALCTILAFISHCQKFKKRSEIFTSGRINSLPFPLRKLSNNNMPTERQLPRLRWQPLDGDQVDSTSTDTIGCPSHQLRPSPALNDLIRALENSPPDNELEKTCSNTDMDAHWDGGDAKVSVTTSDLVYTPGNPIAMSSTTGDDERKRSNRKRKVKQTFAAKMITGNDKNNKNNNASSEKKRAVSDDYEIKFGRKRILKECLDTKKITTEEPNSTVTLEDFIQTIDEALQDQRIDEKKAERLHKCLQSGDWPEVAFSLLCEQIPMKRKGNGYSCRVCQVPKKGHTCMYCHVCSTPEKKFKKDDEHVCINCPTCFEVGKKNKKIIQVQCEGHVCPHAAALRDI